MKKPYINDFGGHGIQRRSRAKLRIDSGTQSFECTDCKKRQYMGKLRASRAAIPRCYHCGGALLETKATQKTNKRFAKQFSQLPPRKFCHWRCRACGLAAWEQGRLESHLRCNLACTRYYEENELDATKPLRDERELVTSE